MAWQMRASHILMAILPERFMPLYLLSCHGRERVLERFFFAIFFEAADYTERHLLHDVTQLFGHYTMHDVHTYSFYLIKTR